MPTFRRFSFEVPRTLAGSRPILADFSRSQPIPAGWNRSFEFQLAEFPGDKSLPAGTRKNRLDHRPTPSRSEGAMTLNLPAYDTQQAALPNRQERVQRSGNDRIAVYLMAAPAYRPAVLPHESSGLMPGRAGVASAQLSRLWSGLHLPCCRNDRKGPIIASRIRDVRYLEYNTPSNGDCMHLCVNLWLREHSSTRALFSSQHFRHRDGSIFFGKYIFASKFLSSALYSALSGDTSLPSERLVITATGCNASAGDQVAVNVSTAKAFELIEKPAARGPHFPQPIATLERHSRKNEAVLVPGAAVLEAGQSIMQAADEHARFVVVNFYRLTNIPDPVAEVAKHQAFVKDKNIKGRIYISEQGINAQLSGPGEEALQYAKWVEDQPSFRGMYLQVSPAPAGHAFPRLNLRYKPSLVQVEGGTACLPLTDSAHGAIPLSPREWREKIEGGSLEGGGRKMLLLDVRNGYEWDVGHFATAARPAVENFRDTDFGMESSTVPEADPLSGVDRAQTDVMMYCTGGIRCDVYSTMLNLREAGFERLYSLQGGVARYLQEEGGKHWVGQLFVFDSRLCVPGRHFELGEQLLRGEIRFEDGTALAAESCDDDAVPSAHCILCEGRMGVGRHRNCANMDCNELYLCCLSCGREFRGCCSTHCMGASRVRPFSDDQHPFAKWHIYRPLEPKRPAGVLTGRALRRLERRNFRKSDAKNPPIVTHDSIQPLRF